MAVNKTKTTNASVTDFIDVIPNEQRRADTINLVEIFTGVTGYPPKMFGPTIIGFGNYHYKYASGHQGEAPLAGFSPRKDSIVLYFEAEFSERDKLIADFGKCKLSKTCVYIKKLDDVDINILKELIVASVSKTNERFPDSIQ